MSDILDYCKGREAQTFKPGQVLIREGGQDGKLFAGFLVQVGGQVRGFGSSGAPWTALIATGGRRSSLSVSAVV